MATPLYCGQRFSTIEEAETAVDAYSKANFCALRKQCCVTVADYNKKVSEKSQLPAYLRYQTLHWVCIHYGQRKIRGDGKRLHSDSYAIGCPVQITISFNRVMGQFIVSCLVTGHENHIVSEEAYKLYLNSRKSSVNEDPLSGLLNLDSSQHEAAKSPSNKRVRKRILTAAGIPTSNVSAVGRPCNPIWSHFQHCGKSSTGPHHRAQCRHCGKEFKRGKISHMKLHIAFECDSVPASCKQEVFDTLDDVGSALELIEDNRQQETIVFTTGSTDEGTSHGEKTPPLQSASSLNSELVKLFIMCNIPFKIVDNPFFRNFVETLKPGLAMPSGRQLSGTEFWNEASCVLSRMKLDLSSETYLTLALDSWTDCNDRELYVYLVITADKRVYLHSVNSLTTSGSRHSHELIAQNAGNVLDDIGSCKFVSLITNLGPEMSPARDLVSTKYPNVISIQCISRLICCVFQDTMKHKWIDTVVQKCHRVVLFILKHLRLREILSHFNLDGIRELRNFPLTRWYLLGCYLKSMLANEPVLKQLSTESKDDASWSQVSEILGDRQFWVAVSLLLKLVNPIMLLIDKLELKTATIADCYRNLIMLAASVQNGSGSSVEFHRHCQSTFAAYWKQFNSGVYLLSYFLHPALRETGLMAGALPRIVESAGSVWKSQGNGKASTMKLLTELMKYKNCESPYDLSYVETLMIPTLWWSSTDDPLGSELKTLALKLHTIAPHFISCERLFTDEGWTRTDHTMSVGELENVGRLYLHYYTTGTPANVNTATTSGGSDEEVDEDTDDNWTFQQDVDSSSISKPLSLSPAEIQSTWSDINAIFDLNSFIEPEINELTIQVAAEETVQTVRENRTDDADDDRDFDLAEVLSQFPVVYRMTNSTDVPYYNTTAS